MGQKALSQGTFVFLKKKKECYLYELDLLSSVVAKGRLDNNKKRRKKTIFKLRMFNEEIGCTVMLFKGNFNCTFVPSEKKV